jgi:hypothetical protein
MNNLLGFYPTRWNLIISPSPKQLLIAISLLAYSAKLTVFDCGRRFDSSVVARAARGRKEIIDNIKIQPAFTCFEAVKLLEQKQIEKTPILVLDFLSTFYDENVKKRTRNYLLEKSIQHFRHLNQFAGLAVSVYPPAASGDSVSLYERLQSAAPSLSDYTISEKENMQLGLFQWEA